jgi:hypothetical protein
MQRVDVPVRADSLPTISAAALGVVTPRPSLTLPRWLGDMAARIAAFRPQRRTDGQAGTHAEHGLARSPESAWILF